MATQTDNYRERLEDLDRMMDEVKMKYDRGEMDVNGILRAATASMKLSNEIMVEMLNTMKETRHETPEERQLKNTRNLQA